MHPLKPGVSEQSLQDFIGNNADKIIRRGSKDISWCWPALLVPSLWLAYRKAYTAAVVVFIIDCFCSAWGLYLLIGVPLIGFHHPILINALVHVLVGLFGMRYYLHLASKRVSKINAETADLTTRQILYRAKGHTSAMGMVIFLILSSGLGTLLYSKGVETITRQVTTTVQTTTVQTSAVQSVTTAS
ncbi:MAG: DUF2628 domain-containing protein [Gammaproteobacteria bacterium]|nr:DUF2628 domain-containing protein [Gammaproteobacteria bacterium]